MREVGGKMLKRPDGTALPLEIYQVDGGLGVRVLKENGEHHFMPFEAPKLIMNRNRTEASAPFRPYVGVKLPADVALAFGRRETTVALYQTAEDKRRGYLRTAHVRAVGPASADFWVYYPKMRGDSESLNRAVEDSLYRHHRAHSVGWEGQQADMLGLASLINALTRERMRRARLAEAAA